MVLAISSIVDETAGWYANDFYRFRRLIQECARVFSRPGQLRGLQSLKISSNSASLSERFKTFAPSVCCSRQIRTSPE